ncbi:uncharacterized protein BXZ73DRAFT_88563 [Epithele typhae]|uniref:uncharacterized protein n=1 Tax=Epithele typhae TaxID=378194 RepID=UPI0020080163|nr:uncharacterized protein BXZ73DRAFT_88563 [Epithele typhae]KAH9940871.1 hypothetical protein BXZ73DRAFT_88563 [Epithele typhae]
MSDDDWNASDDDYVFPRQRRSKRRRTDRKGKAKAVKIDSEEPETPFSLEPLLDVLRAQTLHWEWRSGDADERNDFQGVIEPMLPDLLAAEDAFFREETMHAEKDDTHWWLQRPDCTRSVPFREHERARRPGSTSFTIQRVLRRMALNRVPAHLRTGPLTSLPAARPVQAANQEVIDALYAIKTTPYEHSFLSRLCGFDVPAETGAIAVDWEARTPWMDLMGDVREHYAIAHPERDKVDETIAPITYCTLQRWHLPQVHALLEKAFWDGVDVTDALDYSPEKCTVVATYKRLVVGAAFLSSPKETYITYLIVRSGWDNSQIATCMLYHLITFNPHKDITLHVSINNPAMLLYNRFGFKAEEFILGFYEDYLDASSPQSKNAFRLRLRRW